MRGTPHNNLIPPDDLKKIIPRVRRLLTRPQTRTRGTIRTAIQSIVKRKDDILKILATGETPCYILDLKGLTKSIDNFSMCFSPLPRGSFFYAMKTNHHPRILREVVSHGFGVDVSSIRELDMARAAKAKRIIYSGPGKTEQSLAYAISTFPSIIINLDSFGELARLARVAKKKQVRVGVRITPSEEGIWSKFGIPLKKLHDFWEQAKQYPAIQLEGIQFHLSHNTDEKPYTQSLALLGAYLKKEFSPHEQKNIRFIDMGGGFLPYKSEGYYPWTTPEGIILEQAYASIGKRAPFTDPYYISDSIPLNKYALGIVGAIKAYTNFLPSCEYYLEPGRIISNASMHIALKVVDIKSKDGAILDGGINSVGWERFAFEYFPIINISHPSRKERTATLYGSLCLPGDQDVWGYSYYGSRLEEGDVLVVPYQGCLTYSLAQNFIHPIPPVYIMD